MGAGNFGGISGRFIRPTVQYRNKNGVTVFRFTLCFSYIIFRLLSDLKVFCSVCVVVWCVCVLRCVCVVVCVFRPLSDLKLLCCMCLGVCVLCCVFVSVCGVCIAVFVCVLCCAVCVCVVCIVVCVLRCVCCGVCV